DAIERVLARHLGRPCRILCVAPEDVTALQPSTTADTSVSEEPVDPKEFDKRDADAQTEAASLAPDELRRLEAAKVIFDAVELS
ncbi:MAG: DNA polymerase III subunit gamma/tau, partial [Thermomicrobium sp.]